MRFSNACKLACCALVLFTLVTWSAAELNPIFNKLPNGRIQVIIPGFSGVDNVTVTVLNGSDVHHTLAITTPGADGNWMTRFSDVTNGNDDSLNYAIQYHLHDYVHEERGPLRFANTKPKVESPVTRRYLEKRGTVVFHDDFHSGSIDPTKWSHQITGFGGGSNQVHMLTPEPANSYVKHNQLYIKPTLTVDHFGDDFLDNGVLDVKALWGNCTTSQFNGRGCNLTGHGHIPPIMSAMLLSKASIRYGRVTVVARLPKGDWLWPAIWLMPTESHYGNWPMSGEIDIMESRGNGNYHDHWTHESMGRDYTHAALHYGPHWNVPHWVQEGEFRIPRTTFTDGFHSYWMDWTEDYMKIGVDGHTVLAYNFPAEGNWQGSQDPGANIWASGAKSAPFDRPFYLRLNVAVGGGWFWEGMENAPYPQPWQHNVTKAEQFIQFWNARHLWEPTWHGEDAAMKVRSVTMEQY